MSEIRIRIRQPGRLPKRSSAIPSAVYLIFVEREECVRPWAVGYPSTISQSVFDRPTQHQGRDGPAMVAHNMISPRLDRMELEWVTALTKSVGAPKRDAWRRQQRARVPGPLLEHISRMTPSRGRGVPEACRTQPRRIAAHDHIQDTSRRLRRRLVLVPDEGGVLAVRRPKSRGRTPGTRTKLGEAERRFWRGGRLRRPQQAAFMRWVLNKLQDELGDNGLLSNREQRWCSSQDNPDTQRGSAKEGR